MLDSDLTRLYEIETKNLNRAFKSGIQELKDAMDLLTDKTKPAKIRFKIDWYTDILAVRKELKWQKQ